MKILLLGEYSNVHTVLAKGLRQLGNEVTLAHDGDNWKNYPRDVDMKREAYNPLGSLKYLFRTTRQFHRFRGYDVVQLINPVFLSFKAERIWPFYSYLRRHNRCIVMGAYGMDYYYVKACLDLKTFRYSDFNIGQNQRITDYNREFVDTWLNGSKGVLNRRIATDCDAIVSGLYEYEMSYRAYFPQMDKLQFIPFPIVVPKQPQTVLFQPGEKIRFFIGIQQKRSAYKGTDVMLRAVERVAHEFPEACTLEKAVSVPFTEYRRLLDNSHVILDQLYSYTPAMNALEAMAHGLINVGGAEPESYELLNESELRPIINVQPNEESVYQALRNLVVQKDERVRKLQLDSRAFIEKHHDYVKVARAYEALYRSLLER